MHANNLQRDSRLSAGFSAMSRSLSMPLSLQTETEVSTSIREGNGLNATFDETFHVLCAEPDCTMLRVSVLDGGSEVGYAVSVVNDLLAGYRVFQMRSLLGTRIELCYLLVWISPGAEANVWYTPRHQELMMRGQEARLKDQQKQIDHLMSVLKRQNNPPPLSLSI